jgi:hypothetical protein
VHSLWGKLWKIKNFGTHSGSDLRKRSWRHVEEIFLSRNFIHSLRCGPLREGRLPEASVDGEETFVAVLIFRCADLARPGPASMRDAEYCCG